MIVLLNLIIAIMSDTYEKVMTTIVESDNMQVNTLILYFETMLFWRKNHGEHIPKYLFWFTYIRNSKLDEDWKSQVDHITHTLLEPISRLSQSI